MSAERPIAFTRGVPADESYPFEAIAECAAAAVGGAHRLRVQQYGPSGGFPPLREWLAERHEVAPEQVIVANGSLQLIDLLAWALLERGDTVFVESPTYDRTLTLLRRHGATIVGIPMEADGPDTDALEAALARHRPKLFYTIADFQNPSGATVSLAKRRRIVELAGRHGFRVLEDAPYRPLRYRGSQVTSLVELDGERTVHMSSFTKQISPGVRVGYAIGEKALVARVAKFAEDTYITPSLLGEATVFEFCRRGLLEPQLERLRALYRPRLEAACEAMRRHFPGCEWIEPDGGFFLSVSLPNGVTNEALRARAAERGLALSDGRGFFPNPEDGDRFLRLPFCALTPADIDEGVARLATVVRGLAS